MISRYYSSGKIKAGMLIFILLLSALLFTVNLFSASEVYAQGGGSGQGGGGGGMGSGGEAAETDAVAVETTVSKRGNFADYISVSARTEASAEVELTARLQEVVTAVYVEVGDKVKAGDLLIELDDRKTALKVIQAEASLQNARANLQSALNGARPQEIAQKEAQLEQAESELKLQEEDYNRKKQLFEEGYISQQELDQSANKYTAARSSYRSALKSLELLKMGVREEEILSLKSQVRQSEANLEQAKIEHGYSRITAPISGIISQVNVEKGQMTSAGTAVIITDIDEIELTAYVNEIEVNKIKAGEEVNISFRSLNTNFSGIVKSISPSTAENRQSFPVRIIVDNPENIIKAGMSAQVELKTARAENAVLLSQNAVIEENGKNYVFLIEEGKAVKREIIIALENEETAVVEKGLEASEEVITIGKDNVSDGTPVNVVNRGDS
ncbi:MAG: efflux RND transporter periplasmic adaptor subunit [Bacillota bacterium]